MHSHYYVVEQLKLSSQLIHAVVGFETTTLSSEGIGACPSMNDHSYLDMKDLIMSPFL